MSRVTFTPLAQRNREGRLFWAVKLDKRKVGTVKPIEGKRWQYFPTGSTEGGPIFNTLSECQRDIAGQS